MMDLIRQEGQEGQGDRGEATAPLAEAIRKWERRAPELWKRCYPRHYEVGQQYASPKQLALKLLELRVQAELSHRHSEAKQSQNMLMMWAAAGLVNLQVPLFFVAPDLLTAVRLSIPPVDLDWRALPLPFTSAAFALPRGSLKHDTRGEVSYIWYTRIRKGEAYPIFPASAPIGICDEDAIVIAASCMESAGRMLYSIMFTGSSTPTLNLVDLSEGPDRRASSLNGLHADDHTMIGTASALLFSLLFAMNAREGLWEKGSFTGKKTRSGLEFWTPNVLGRTYRLRARPSEAASGISPRMHWRRGHMRQQAYGQGRTLRRSQWIEPVLVAAPE
jgi:hypothetical protein